MLHSYGIFVGYGRGELSFYLTVFPYRATVTHGTTLIFVMSVEG